MRIRLLDQFLTFQRRLGLSYNWISNCFCVHHFQYICELLHNKFDTIKFVYIFLGCLLCLISPVKSLLTTARCQHCPMPWVILQYLHDTAEAGVVQEHPTFQCQWSNTNKMCAASYSVDAGTPRGLLKVRKRICITAASALRSWVGFSPEWLWAATISQPILPCMLVVRIK